MIASALILVVMATSFGAVFALNRSARWTSDYASAMAVALGQLETMRATPYKPPTYPFTSATVLITNTSKISLNRAGSSYLVTGVVVTATSPQASGHLVTVTGRFTTYGGVVAPTVQTVINELSGGQP